MSIKKQSEEQLKKVQALPEKTRKIIFWTLFVIFSLILIAIWVRWTEYNIQKFNSKKVFENMEIPSFGNSVKDMQEGLLKIEESLENVNVSQPVQEDHNFPQEKEGQN